MRTATTSITTASITSSTWLARRRWPRRLDEVADAIRTERALDNKAVVRGYAEITYRAGSWDRDRRVIARIEATEQGSLCRTKLGIGSAEWVYNSLYCARGQAENLIKLHKTQLASDLTSCRSALANQVRLVFDTAAYWLVLTIRDVVPNHPRFSNGRVHHQQAAAAENRRPRHRDCRPRPSRLCGSLS